LFELQLNEPQNFASYRQAEVDAARITSFTQLEQYPYLAKRFLLSRFLGLTEEEMSDNERMWAEEQGDTEKAPSEAAGLRSIGISPGGLEGLSADLEAGAAPAPEGAAVPGGASPIGAAAPATGSPTTAPSAGL
jgi:hypothetical protein